MNIKKSVIYIVSLVLSASIISGCSGINNTDSVTSSVPDKTSVSSMDNTENQIQPADNITDLPDNVIMSIGGHNVSADEYKYYFAYARYSIDGGDEDYWKDDNSELKISDLKKQTYDYLYSLYTIYSLADQEAVALDSNDMKNIDDQYNAAEKYYNTSEINPDVTFDEYLKNTCCTKEVFRETLKRSKLEKKVISKLFESDFREKNFTDYIRVKYIYIDPQKADSDSADFFNSDPLLDYSDEELSSIEKINSAYKTRNKEALEEELSHLMNYIEEKIQSGESIDSFISKYNMDKDIPLNDDGSYQGYYIKNGDRSESFCETAFSLSEDQTSDIVKTENDGWYIIKREKFDENYLKDYLINIYMSNPDYGYTEKYTEIYSVVQKKMETIFSNSYNDISYDYASINYEL